MADLKSTKADIEKRKSEKASQSKARYDKGYEKGLKNYGAQAAGAKFPKGDRFLREKMYDPVMDALGGGNDYDKGDRKARKDVLDYKKGGKVKCMTRGGGIEVRGKTRGKIC